jgi:2-isopropylmalate synthase
LTYLNINSGTNSIPTATVSIKNHEKIYSDSATGDGAVDAIFNAVNRALNIETRVESYQVRSVTGGREAMGEVIVRLRYDEKSFTGRGVSTDVIEASAKAYVNAVNQLEKYKIKTATNNDEEINEVV